MPGPPPPLARRFHDLGTVVDELHALFAAWADAGTFADAVDDFGLCVAQLAVHEWVANLVQHAAFGGRRPEIALAVAAEADGLRCVIEDNSDGFDFQRQLDRQEALVAEPEPSERGRGLLMMIACTEELLYEPTADGRQRLAFVVRPAAVPESLLPLFPAPHAHPEPPAGPAPGDAPGDTAGDTAGDGAAEPSVTATPAR